MSYPARILDNVCIRLLADFHEPGAIRRRRLTVSMSHDEAAAEQYYDELSAEIIGEAMEDLAKEPVCSYMNRYGDAVEARIFEFIERSRHLLDADYFGPSLVSAGTAIELTIRYLIISPLVQGAFLSDHWAQILSGWVLPPTDAKKDKDLLPHILTHWNIDIKQVQLEGGKFLWQELTNAIRPGRNRHVHRGDPVTKELAMLGYEAAEVLMQIAVEALANVGAKKLNGKWCHSGAPEGPFTKP